MKPEEVIEAIKEMIDKTPTLDPGNHSKKAIAIDDVLTEIYQLIEKNEPF